jgi:L-seryl-tRNA(Ser) seleniumtransferase
MGIPSWAVEALMRSVGTVVDKVPPERFDHLKQRAGQWLDDLPHTAARGVDSMFRGARASKEKLDRWARRHVALVTPVINASGVLTDPRLQGVPLGDQAIDLAVEALAAPALRTPAAIDRLHRRLHHCTGRNDLAILVSNSVNAACLAVAMSRRGRPLYIHRSQAVRLSSGTPIPEAFLPVGGSSTAHEHVHEVGSVDSVAPGDSDSIASDAILIAVDNGGDHPLWFAAAMSGGQSSASAATARTRVLVVTACGGLQSSGELTSGWQRAMAPPLRGATHYLGEQQSAGSVDLVIAAGDGLLGGPSCGLLIGRKSLIESIATSQAWPALAAGIATTATMVQTLETLHSGAPESLPVIAMLKTKEDNLRSRAERLATRLSANETIQTCQITDESAKLTPTGPWRISSRQLRIRHRDKPAAQWSEQLASDVPAVLARVDDDSLMIDLRWVQPSDDGPLAAALLGETAAEQPEESIDDSVGGSAAESSEHAGSEPRNEPENRSETPQQ